MLTLHPPPRGQGEHGFYSVRHVDPAADGAAEPAAIDVAAPETVPAPLPPLHGPQKMGPSAWDLIELMHD